jgi:2,4-dienoyl-CoA reductase-like NADH-dependent reductase (Old Yellow Enzyme family)
MRQTERLQRRVEAFLKRTGLSATAFGVAALKDPNFVTEMRNGRSARDKTVERVESFMKGYKS